MGRAVTVAVVVVVVDAVVVVVVVVDGRVMGLVVGRVIGLVERFLVQQPLGSQGKHPPDVLIRKFTTGGFGLFTNGWHEVMQRM